MFLKKILILFLTATAMVGAYFIQEFLKKKINPRRSFGHFILYIIITIIIVFGMIFLLTLFLYQFRNFFFKL
jgi:heme/copper-type cytochrome/quinol oxidase subunit 2